MTSFFRLCFSLLFLAAGLLHGAHAVCSVDGVQVRLDLGSDFADHDGWGLSVSLSGSEIAVGAPGHDAGNSNTNSEYGRVTIFEEVSTDNWILQSILLPPGGIVDMQDYFGQSVALEDGILAVGADGDDTMASAAGIVHVYKKTTTYDVTPVDLVAIDAAANDHFGWSVSLSGTALAVGAYLSHTGCGQNPDQGGAVYIFMSSSIGSQDWVHNSRHYPSDCAVNSMYRGADWFGHDLALDGKYMISAAEAVGTSMAPEVGQVYIFHQDAPGIWAEQQIVYHPDPGSYFNARFGASLDISGQNMIIGQTGIPRIHIYHETTLDQGDWSVVAQFDGNMGDFGYAVAISGSNAVAGSPMEDPGSTDEGRIRVYHEDSPGSWSLVGSPIQEELFAQWTRFGEVVEIDGSTVVATTAWADSGGFTSSGRVTMLNLVDCTPDFCLGHSCTNGATCVNGGSGYTCDCVNGYTNTLCDTEINECDSSPCINAGVCADAGVAAFTCDCTGTGFEGDMCQTEVNLCDETPCFNAGVCTFLGGGAFTCDCSATAFEGDFCETLIDDCASSPCSKGGICSDAGISMFTCDCTGTGYTGLLCGSDIDDCASSPCMYGGSCTDVGANAFECLCTGTGYEGTTCESDVDDCASSPCKNDGACTDRGPNLFECDCDGTGYEGLVCDSELDECASSPCGENAISCTDLIMAFECDCMENYSGELCTDFIGACASSPCQNMGTCVEAETFGCICPEGYTGVTCDKLDSSYSSSYSSEFSSELVDPPVDTDACLSSPCANGETCVDGVFSFTCNAPTNTDPCLSSPCPAGKECQADAADASTFTCSVTGVLEDLDCPDAEVDCNDATSVEVFLTASFVDDIGGDANDYDVTVTLHGDGTYDVIVVYADPDGTFTGDDANQKFVEEIESGGFAIRVNGIESSMESAAAKKSVDGLLLTMMASFAFPLLIS